MSALQPAPRVSLEVIQGFFDFLAPLSGTLRAKSLALGIDPARPEPDYPAEAFSELVLVGARERFADRPLEQALEQLGRENVLAMQRRHPWLSAMLPMMRLVGPHRVLSKANARRIGQSNTALSYTQKGPTDGELVISPCPLPSFQAGVVAQVVVNAGGKDARAEVLRSSPLEAVFHVRWAAQ